MKRIVDWIFTIPFLVAFGLVLVVFDPIARVARQFGLRPMEIVMGVMQRALLVVFHITGARLEVERSPGVRPRTGYVLVSNHQSMFDVPIFGGLLFSNYPKYVAKEELGKGFPSISYNLRRGGNTLIDRNDRRQSLQAIRELGAECQRRDVSVVIFPEGTRARSGELGEFKVAGTAVLLRAADRLPLVPTTIDGSWILLRDKMFPIPFGTRIRVRFGDPIERHPDEDHAELLARCRSDIEATLESWRAKAPA